MVGPAWPVRDQRPRSRAVSGTGEDQGEHVFHHDIPGLQPVGQLGVVLGAAHVARHQAGQRPPPPCEWRGGLEGDRAIDQCDGEGGIAEVRIRQIQVGDRAPRIERERQVQLPIGIGVPIEPVQDLRILMMGLGVLRIEGDGPLERLQRAFHGTGVVQGEEEAPRHPGVGGGRVAPQRAVRDAEPAAYQALERDVGQRIVVAAGDRVGIRRPPDRRGEPGVEPLGFPVFGEGAGDPFRRPQREEKVPPQKMVVGRGAVGAQRAERAGL